MRAPHYLKRNHGGELPWEVVWVDTETRQTPCGTDEVKHELNFGWACYRRRARGMKWGPEYWYRFHTRAGLWEWLERILRPRTRLYLFSHNLGFDLPVVDAFNELPRRGFKLLKAVIECPPVILKWRRGTSTIECIDTLNLWRQSLAAVGDSIAQGKLTMPKDTDTREAWDVYCRRDVEVIMEMCLSWWQFLQDNDLGGFAPTIASQAMRSFRHRFMHQQIFIDDDERACELSRDSYHGGRVECYRLGKIKERLTLLDINSLFPAYMRDAYMPVKLVSHTTRASVRDLIEWSKTRCLIAEVTLDTDQPIFPIVHDHRLVFPVGRFTASLATPELARALALGMVKSCNRVAVYERAVLFTDYVDTCYTGRLASVAAGNKLYGQHWKYLMNSLYGKFGQNGRVFCDAGEAPDLNPRYWLEIDADTGKVIKMRQLAGLVQQFVEEGESRDSMPAIASHITSGARLILWDMQIAAGRENVYYCDTDSLLVNDTGRANLSRLIDPSTLGMLKVELEMPGCELWGAKDYLLGDRWKTKGVRKGAAWTSPSTIVQEQWTTLIGLVRDGDLTAPRTKWIKKTLSRAYTKGRVQRDGSVLPLVLGDDAVSGGGV